MSKSSPRPRSSCYTAPRSTIMVHPHDDPWACAPGEESLFCIWVKITSDINKQNVRESDLHSKRFSVLKIQRNVTLGRFRCVVVWARIFPHFTLLSSAMWLLSLGLSPMVLRWFLKFLEIIQIQGKKSEAGEKTLLEVLIFFFKGGKSFINITQKIYPYVSDKTYPMTITINSYKGDWESKEIIFLNFIVWNSL